MVCYKDEGPFPITVQDNVGKKQCFMQITHQKKVDEVINDICRQFSYSAEEIDLSISTKNGKVSLASVKEKTIHELGVQCGEISDMICINPAKEMSDDDLLLGASASPISVSAPAFGAETPNNITDNNYYSDLYVTGEMRIPDEDCTAASSTTRACLRPAPAETINYVGLVNQAMTCYLNSLLQALYMTPEFRNALYKWEYVGSKESRSIPYELQKLFLNLQTSRRPAVETTDLTASFGWQNSDAWQQHDIQELCRVMFDALEKKFKDTEQANLINDLYEGKMLDYVKCLECGTEKSREDTFLDIPLPVKPFGSAVAYNSVEEALRGFVQPETLEGSNQYHCEKCNKKCDAHKGLKFTKFPYLLTLHLKRFDFDYSTMHRIKLNDKVVFPDILNLNSFIQCKTNSDTIEEREQTVKCDDCSTTDSGSALDDESCQGTDASSTTNGQDDNCGDSDEGIDVSSGTNLTEIEAQGPFLYELFSIMIHSGSASGGHYYAYIKDFDTNQWFCFNDQSVHKITEDDIRKTYGGGPLKPYYSGAYSFSTNAYMLMYRQIDKARNARVIRVDEFPPHIQKLLNTMREREEQNRLIREKEKDVIKMNVFCYHPVENVMKDCKIAMLSDSTLAEAASTAYRHFMLEDVVSLEDCRIVTYNKKRNCIDGSFESDELKFCDIEHIVSVLNYGNWMLEIKRPGFEFDTYRHGGINMKVYPVNLETGHLEDVFHVRIDTEDTVRDLRLNLAKILNRELKFINVALDVFCNGPRILSNDLALFFKEFDSTCMEAKLLVSSGTDYDEPEKFGNVTKFHKVLSKLGNIMILEVVLPNTDPDTLQLLQIPSLDLNQNLDARQDMSADASNFSSSRVSPQPGQNLDGFGDLSNSEDSSLSDSDRTLVGEAPGDVPGLLSSNSDSPADQHMASPIDPTEDSYNYDVLGPAGVEENWDHEMSWDDSETNHLKNDKPLDKFQEPYRLKQSFKDYYFRVVNTVRHSPSDPEMYVKSCLVHADGLMSLKHFKQHLELLIRVPLTYFKIFRRTHSTDEEWTRLSDNLKVAKDEEQLIVKLGRVRRRDEFLCKVYHFRPDVVDHSRFLFEKVVGKGQLVGQMKREILQQGQKMNLIDSHLTPDRCRLREKTWKNPKKVFLDDQKFNTDITVPNNFEVFFQEINEPEKVISVDQVVLFVRQWSPSELKLSPFQEVVLDNSTTEDFKRKLSELSQIPPEYIDIANIKANFPCELNALEIERDLDWNGSDSQIHEYSYVIGNTYFFKDSREQTRELTEEEKKELGINKSARLTKFSPKNYSPGRERALKIYVDSSPSKTEDID